MTTTFTNEQLVCVKIEGAILRVPKRLAASGVLGEFSYTTKKAWRKWNRQAVRTRV